MDICRRALVPTNFSVPNEFLYGVISCSRPALPILAQLRGFAIFYSGLQLYASALFLLRNICNFSFGKRAFNLPLRMCFCLAAFTTFRSCMRDSNFATRMRFSRLALARFRSCMRPRSLIFALISAFFRHWPLSPVFSTSVPNVCGLRAC